MLITRSNALNFIPASHEDKKSPGVLKKVLIRDSDFYFKGRLKMINWAKLRKGRSFRAHFHEDMDEIFIILKGEVEIIIEKEKNILKKGDLVVIPRKKIHKMKNTSSDDIEYLALGLSSDKGGRTVLTEKLK